MLQMRRRKQTATSGRCVLRTGTGGSLLSMRTMSFAGSFPYESITVPVNIIIGEEDAFLLKTAKRVCSLPADSCRLRSCCMHLAQPLAAEGGGM